MDRLATLTPALADGPGSLLHAVSAAITAKLIQNLHMTVNLADSKEEVETVYQREFGRKNGRSRSALSGSPRTPR
jgi:hypothetical protein